MQACCKCTNKQGKFGEGFDPCMVIVGVFFWMVNNTKLPKINDEIVRKSAADFQAPLCWMGTINEVLCLYFMNADYWFACWFNAL